ncbi:MAG: hypothetical protein JST26_11780 [Bacteroidetes bacterium]|nr:hypothetical protein [Bacteroidota bacterium]
MRPSLKARKRLNLNAELRLNSHRNNIAANDPVFAELLFKQNKSWTKTWMNQTSKYAKPAKEADILSEYRWWEN